MPDVTGIVKNFYVVGFINPSACYRASLAGFILANGLVHRSVFLLLFRSLLFDKRILKAERKQRTKGDAIFLKLSL
jgi:hypothetical protein